MKSDTQKKSEIEAAEVFEIKTLVENYPETTQSVPFFKSYIRMLFTTVANFFKGFFKNYFIYFIY